MRTNDVAGWRKSSFSGSTNCVFLARLPDDSIGLRNSNQPHAGMINLTRSQLSDWLKGIKAGEYDSLVQ